MTRKQVAALIIVLGGVAFGALGGEYNTRDWWTLRQNLQAGQDAVERLQVETDSLGKVAKALESDSAAQERAARESFGMLRKGEILYRIEPAKP
ncbi:MAG: septum formation initiator family protein [Gemmatimonadetes bacterium]|nr:septum formation initiator family protein [Gemmatimonadota bacterium]